MSSKKYTGSESIFKSIPEWIKRSVKFQRLLQAINSSPELIAAVDQWAATPNAHFRMGGSLGEDDGKLDGSLNYTHPTAQGGGNFITMSNEQIQGQVCHLAFHKSSKSGVRSAILHSDPIKRMVWQ